MARPLQALGSIGMGLGLGLAPTAPALAEAGQVGGAVSVESDYRLRGVSLTDGRPAASLNLAYDHPSGAYAGASVVVQDASGDGPRLLGHMEYVGYSARAGQDYSWDVGVNNQDFVPYGPRRSHLRYSEVYVGLAKGDLSARVYYSPNYLRTWGDTAYLDLNGVLRPADNWRVTGHAGALVPLGDGSAPVRTRYDLRVGLARDFKAGEVHAAVTTAFPTPESLDSRSRVGLVVGASLFF